MKHPYLNQVSFAVGTGRCGTKFLYQLFQKEANVASHHERHPLSDTFERYCHWNQLPVDSAGFLTQKEEGIKQDLSQHTHSFEASAYLSLSLISLYQKFDAKFIFLVRSPHKVVNSYLQKQWYEHSVCRRDKNLAAGFQPGTREPHHSFSRLVPRGEEAEKWTSYTQVGKIAWFWRVVNESILQQFAKLPEEQYRIIRIEDFDFRKYQEVCHFLAYSPTLSAKDFENLTSTKPNRLYSRRTVADWSEKACQEFENEVASLSERWNYPWQTAQLITKEASREVKQPPVWKVKYQQLRKELQLRKKLIQFLERH
ncbi:MAG: hypothetical protein AAF992_19525 [Bacteroidota bacterium]